MDDDAAADVQNNSHDKIQKQKSCLGGGGKKEINKKDEDCA
jgi:hypothetical protein